MTGKKTAGNSHRFGRFIDTAWLTGAQAIASVIGMNRNDIPNLVKTEGFPAFKWRGRWRAIPDDIALWSRQIAERHRKKNSISK